MIGAEFLQCHIGVGSLVRGVRVHEHRGLVGHHFLEDRGDRFALGEPLPPVFGQQLRRFGLFDHPLARPPSIPVFFPVSLFSLSPPVLCPYPSHLHLSFLFLVSPFLSPSPLLFVSLPLFL